MNRTLVGCALVAILVMSLASGPQQGINSSCINAQCSVHASTSLIGLLASAAMMIFVVWYPQKAGTPASFPPVTISERFAAFFVDFLTVLLAVTPMATLPLLLSEADATGSFRFSFERDFSRPADATFAFLGSVFVFMGLFAYFYIHAVTGRQTVGQYLLGYRVVGFPGSSDKPAFGLNVLLGFFGLCAWPVSVYFAAKRQDKAFWWNLRTRTQLVRLV